MFKYSKQIYINAFNISSRYSDERLENGKQKERFPILAGIFVVYSHIYDGNGDFYFCATSLINRQKNRCKYLNRVENV